MKKIKLPLGKNDKKARINFGYNEINIAQLLSCTQVTIKSYVDKDLLPEPVFEENGNLYFSREAVIDALGLKNLDEPLISFKEAVKILNITIYQLEKIVKNGVFTQIKLSNAVQFKRLLVKREVDDYEIVIEGITKSMLLKNEAKFFKIFF